MTLAVVMVTGLVLVALGLAGASLRRSLVGVVIGIELAAGGVVLIATALFDLTGTVTSTGGVVAVALVAFGVAIAVLAVALHLSPVRTARRGSDLDPW